MEKISWDAKQKIWAREKGSGHKKEYSKPGPRDRPTTRPSWRPFEKEQEYTPLNSRHEDILREVYHLKFLPLLGHPKGVP